MTARYIGSCEDCGRETRASTKPASRCRRCQDNAWEERFWGKVDFLSNGPCWEWTGAVGPHGYGTFHNVEGWHRVHRLSYRLVTGPVPADLTIDHLCVNRTCVNPAHMEVVTRGENVRRANQRRAA